MSHRTTSSRGLLQIGVVALTGVLGCRAGNGTSSPAAGRRIEFSVSELGSGFKAVKRRPPSLEILADDAGYQAAAERDELAYRVPGQRVPVVDFTKNVVMLLERGDEGGHDIRPTIKRVVRRGHVLTVATGFERLPDAQDLDLMARPYLYFAVPREAVDGNPEVDLIVDGDRYAQPRQ